MPPIPVRTILDDLNTAGFNVSLTDDGGVKVTPASRLTPQLRCTIRAHKASIIQRLRASNDPQVVPRARARMTAPWSDDEIERFMARVQRFTSRGLDMIRAESLADKLATRDRDDDDRRLCIECRSCDVARRCSSTRMAGLGSAPTAPLGDLAFMLQRCPAFKEAIQ